MRYCTTRRLAQTGGAARKGEHEVDDRRKKVRTRANGGSEQTQLEAQPRVDLTEGRFAALKGKVPGDVLCQ